MVVSAFIATSLDGYIARENGDLDWLPGSEGDDQSEDFGFTEFFASVDCLVMGRHSLEAVLRFPEWPYEGKRVIVLSRTMKRAPAPVQGKIALYSGSLTGLVDRLVTEGCTRIYVDGGATIRSFLSEGLLTDITICIVPILLGKGIPLFAEVGKDIPLRHRETRSYDNGLVQSVYEVEIA